MTKTILAFTLLASVAALPALASEEYQDGPTRPITAEVATRDTGSVQYPAFDGQFGLATPPGSLVRPNASVSTVESVNSAPVGALSDAEAASR